MKGEKERARRRKGREEKKQWLHMYTLKKKLSEAKGPFADNVIKNPA